MLVSPFDEVARAKANIDECTVTDAKKLLTPGTLLIDIREDSEFRQGYVPGAVSSPRGLLEFEIHALVQRTAAADIAPEDLAIVLYCGTGGRSALAADTLTRMGYRNVKSMDGGIVAWSAAGFPVETPD